MLKMVAAKAPESWLNELWEISSQLPFKKTQRRAKKPEMWMSFYSVRNSTINLRDLELGQEEEMAEKIWEWVKKQLRDSDFESSVSLITQHLAKLGEDAVNTDGAASQ